MFGLTFIGCWIIDSKAAPRKQKSRQQLNLSRALAWMVFFGFFFVGLANVARIAYFWTLGEQIAVHFSSQMDLFYIWMPIGFMYGFIYGIDDRNTYADKNIASLIKAIFLIFFIIAAYSFVGLTLIVYPLQRLTPIFYEAQKPDYLFYLLMITSIPFFIPYIMQRASFQGHGKSLLTSIVFIPLITLHCVILSGYSVTIDLTLASFLEDKQQLSEARNLYSKTIPYIKHDKLLAALHHRLGVLNVMNENYQEALKAFKKVMADYSDDYDVYRKAKRYLESYEKNISREIQGKKILNVQHQTFEQAASCFPNSLAVILNFYEEEPISTRALSYSIKEGFDEGSFIWKAESFLEKNDYKLVTTLWQSKEMLIRLLEAGYPVLIYIPGHVYTLYGYDARMEMFFTFDTAQANRWNDNPFYDLQKTWMDTSFLMSAVVRNEDMTHFAATFPELFSGTDFHRLWQKTSITRYYKESKKYWIDFDPYEVSAALNLDRLKTKDPYFSHGGFSSFAWEPTTWDREILPVWQNSWAVDWTLFRKHTLYLLDHKEIGRAQHLMDVYTPHFNREYDPVFAPLFELQLAINLAAGNKAQVLSLSDNLIGITGDQYEANDESFYWSHYYKGKSLLERGEVTAAVELMLPIIQDINLDSSEITEDLKGIVRLLTKIIEQYPMALEKEEQRMVAIARISLAMTD
ncbi:MAG: hypothetical protein KKG53_04860 [Proteobacteria bacterium]|nr:hypothetical protein [Pseudomonadota bacterium]